jgi:hypothetical protein
VMAGRVETAVVITIVGLQARLYRENPDDMAFLRNWNPRSLSPYSSVGVSSTRPYNAYQ